MFTAGALAGHASQPARAQDAFEPLRIGQATLDVQFQDEGFDLSRQEIRAWVATCAAAVSKYLGDFPVPPGEDRDPRL